MKPLLILTLFLLVFCSGLAAQDNPFADMVGKPYAIYAEELERIAYRDADARCEEWAADIASQMREAALSGDRKWNLEASLFEANYRFYRWVYLEKPGPQETGLLAEEMIVILLSIAKHAERSAAADIRIRALYYIMLHYAYASKNYEMVFRYCHELDKAMSAVSADEFPFKPVYLVQIALQYNYFQEYEPARLYLEKVLENPDAAYRMRVLETTWNDLGLIHRNHYKDLAASDSCFSRILELKPADPDRLSPAAGEEIRLSMQEEYELWAAIASGNLGHNAYLRGDYDKAIPLLRHGLEGSVAGNPYNYPYAASKAMVLARIFLEKNDLSQVKLYAGTAYGLLDKERKRYKVEVIFRNADLWATYYQIMSTYWRMCGDYREALFYSDSTRTMRALFEGDFSPRKLHRAEQRIKQEEIETERLRSELFRRTALVVTGFLTVILALLLLLCYYYTKKRKAYRELVQRSKQWADSDTLEKAAAYTQAEPVPEDNESNDKACLNDEAVDRQEATEKDARLTDMIHGMMIGQRLYSDSTLTLDSLARMLGVNREAVSRSINRTTGKNFTRFLNEYRIKEAVRYLLAARNKMVNFDELVEGVGFNNRTTFHRAFKQITGLTPNEFKNNG